MSQISELGKKEGRERDRKLKELLAKSFPVIKIKALRPVVMCILKHMPHVDDKYLKILVRDRELYDACDTEVLPANYNHWLRGGPVDHWTTQSS